MQNLEERFAAPHSSRVLSQYAAAGARPQFRFLALFFVGYLAGAGFGQLISVVPDLQITLWPPGGLFLATLLVSRRETWIWWVLTALCAELAADAFWYPSPLPAQFGYFTANAVEALAGALLMTRVFDREVRLETMREVIVFAVLCSVVAPLAGATIGSATIALQSRGDFWEAWPWWWLGDATGTLTFAPVALVVLRGWRDGSTRRPTRSQIAEILALAGVFIAIGALSLSGRGPFAFFILPPLLWAAVRFETRGAAVTLVLLALMISVFTFSSLELFPHGTQTQHQRRFMLQLFLATSSLSAFSVAALARQHNQSLLDVQSANAELEARVKARTQELSDREKRLNFAISASGSGSWESGANHREFVASDRAVALHGLSPGSKLNLSVVHPDDRAHTAAAVAYSMASGEPYHAEYRVVHSDGSIRWLASDAELRNELGRRRLIGLVRDVTLQKQREQQIALLMHEVNHRSKNLLALVLSIARQTSAIEDQAFVERFTARIHSLSSSHDLLVDAEWIGIEIGELVHAQLDHFRDIFGTRIKTRGDPLRLSPVAAQNIGMALHELATNAAKYGALSNDEGRVEIAWLIDDRGAGGRFFSLSWRERDGPKVREPTRRGFGSTVLSAVATLSLSGTATAEFAADGVMWRLECPAEKALES